MILGDLRIDLGIRALQIDIRDDRRPPVTWPGDVDDAGVRPSYEAVQMRIHQAQTGGRSPVAEQPRFDVFRLQGLPKQRIRAEIDLGDRQIICGVPIADERGDLGVGGRMAARGCGRLGGHAPMIARQPDSMRPPPRCRKSDSARASGGEPPHSK